MSGGDPNRFPLRRYKFKRAGIKHFQRPLLEKDIPEAEKLLKDLLDRANKTFLKMSEIVDLELADEVDPAGTVRRELIRLNRSESNWSREDIRSGQDDGKIVSEESSVEGPGHEF